MADIFEQIRAQIHEVRNIVGPVHLKLTAMEEQITKNRTYLEEKVLALESKLLSTLFRLDKQDARLAEILAWQQKLEKSMSGELEKPAPKQPRKSS